MIRAAAPADARAIAEVQTRAWWRAYQDIVDGSVLAGQDVDERQRRWATEIAERPAGTLVAEVAGRVVGFATVGLPREPEADDAVGELQALYVDPPAQGAGVGTALLDAAHAELRAQGFPRAMLVVFDANHHARGFYERHGWRHDGRPATVYRYAPVVRYEREL